MTIANFNFSAYNENTFKKLLALCLQLAVPKEHLNHLLEAVLWTRAYCLISAKGAPLSVLKKYIEDQEKPEASPFIST